MSNLIKLKRGSGSDPQASDLVVGEVAVRTDTGKLFTKKDDNSVAEIGAGLSDGDKGDITVSNNGATFTIDTNVIANGNIASNAAIAGSKIDPDFGSQGITTTGNSFFSDLTLENAQPSLILSDNNAESDFAVQNRGGVFTVRDIDNNANRFEIASDGAVSAGGTITSTFSGNLTGNVTGNTSGSSGSCTGNAATATKLETARTIAGVSFDGSANISLNNNAITNGAGYITATLTNEQVQDIVGGMVSGNTESGITVTYQDSDGTLDFSVASQTDNNFTTTLKNKLDGIASGATNVTNTNQLTNGAGFITATLTNEQVQDIVGGMVSGNTESGITVTYQDSDGTLDFSVASQTDNNFTNADHSKLDGIEAGATADQSASEILTLIKTVDGAGSGLDADTLDGVSSGSFARSDANDTLSGVITLSSTSRDCLNFSGSTSEDNRGIAFNGRIAISADNSDGWLRLNNASEFSNGVYTPLTIRADNGFVVDSTTVINGSGNYVRALSGASDYSSLLRANADDTATGVLTLNAGLSFGADAKCAAGISSLSDGSTITVNFASGIHHSVTLGGNRTFGSSSTSVCVGQSGSIFITQDGTGSRTASFNSHYKFAGGTAPTLSTGANAVDRIDYVIKASNVIHCVVTLDVK